MVIPRIYKFAEKEIHMVGDSVGVCWNIKTIKKELVQDGLTYTARTTVRNGEPYIVFVEIREYDNIFYESEKNPAVGGIDTARATTFSEELLIACKYIQQIGEV